ncbi:MAG: ribbon-helix-helix protein, CopG family [Burkholderiales bacterium]
MRTTIELTDDQRAKLLALAARRRLRGYSALIREALERYLGEGAEQRQVQAGAKAARTARKIRGSLSETEAERMRRRIDELWRRWR